ncbi:hypothetical protein Mgra_00000359 [Meloidogyne graminicola]|uniref:EF-hand domain-containing protein n=1 Tax=Meloidogyne graminicola TaxID=189291 RepID=A0A8T0A1H4_9BILA|nr:hypothetical protein Mgra_00000359 [Meloidogyne graminicola]
MIVNPIDNIGSYIPTQGVPVVSRDGTYSTAYNASIPLGLNPQSLYIQSPATVANFQTTTGYQFASANSVPLLPQNTMPNPIHIKTRVYVPNQIVGILIGTKGQTIKSVIAESGAIIRIEGDRDPTPSSSSAHQNTCNSIDASQENSYNNTKSTATCVEIDLSSAISNCKLLQENGTLNGPIKDEPLVSNSLATCVTVQVNGDGHKKINNGVSGHPPGLDQRGVFISGYDFQVSRALFWVFRKVAENQNMRAEEIFLTCESIVPSKVVGRIIGKNGQNVKRLQLKSGATIKVPEDLNQNDKNSIDAAVRVVGNFYAVQMVQHHFGMLILDTEWRESKEFKDKRSRFNHNLSAYDPLSSHLEYPEKQYYSAQGMIVNPIDNIGSYIPTQGVPVVSRDGTYSTAYNASIPLGLNPQSLYIQSPATVANFQTTTGYQFASANSVPLLPQNTMPNPIHIKTRVYVPNQIVGILIGTKGQTIKSVIAESGAIIRIEGDRDPTPSSSSVHQNTCNSIDASQENSYNNTKSTATCVEIDLSSAISNCNLQEENGTLNGPIKDEPLVSDSLATCVTVQVNGDGHKKINNGVSGHPPGLDQRGVFISGYDFQVSRIVMRALGLEPRQEEVNKLMSQMMEDSTARSINKEAFTAQELANLLSDRLKIDKIGDEIQTAFHLFDSDEKGFIDVEDLKRVTKELGEELNEDELKEMIQIAEYSTKGQVTSNEFKNVMKKISLY